MSNLDLTLLTATGFQLFLPLLILSGAAYTGSSPEEWLDAREDGQRDVMCPARRLQGRL